MKTPSNAMAACRVFVIRTGWSQRCSARSNTSFYQGERDLFVLAALYAEGIVAHNHPFNDGNKRTGHNTAALFLLVNGHDLRRAMFRRRG